MSTYFDKKTYQSRSSLYKQPYGAVSSGTQVTFSVRPLRSHGIHHARLVAEFEFAHHTIHQLDMLWSGLDGNRDIFTCTLPTEGYIGLVWYHFQLDGSSGPQQSRQYQLTVYDGTDRVPDWFGKGLCYHIFPDRFYRTRIPDPTGLVGNRTVHLDWHDDPISEVVGLTPHGKDICNRDFFGGNLPGVIQKLDYLQSLGVETIYFCPIFEAAENHRYGTADYDRIDPMLGDLQDFKALCDAAHRRGMYVLLDGVFNHTGFISRYFNGDGFYPTVGAGQSQDSPYRSWFQFKHWPDDYDCWWGIYSLPSVEENDPDYRRFIFDGPDAVVRKWLQAGADGWRLDVADELPDDFVHGIHNAVRQTNPNAIVIGEVWEDGTTKISYNVRRRHLLGHHLDGLMNYPFRDAVIRYLLGGDARAMQDEMEALQENYPPSAFYSAMNALGTHDTLRILTCLGTGDTDPQRTGKAGRITPQQRSLGLARLRLGALILYTFPGAPTLYYGDEVGMDGYHDPFNRRPFPWDNMDQALLAHFRLLGQLRRQQQPLRQGAITWGDCQDSLLCFYRTFKGNTLCTVVNAGDTPLTHRMAWTAPSATDLLTGQTLSVRDGCLALDLPPFSGFLLSDSTVQ